MSGNHGGAPKWEDPWSDGELDWARMNTEALDDSDSVPEGWRRLVDLQIIHVLLVRLWHDDAVDRKRRIESVMAQIDRERVAPAGPAQMPDVSLRARSGWWITGVSIAAALLIAAVGIYWSLSPGRSAQAAVRAAMQTAALPMDRQYRIQSIVRSHSGSLLQCEGTLYLRGGERFALCHPGPLGDVWIGSDGKYEWMVPVDNKPVMSETPNFALRWVQIDGVGLPDFRLTEILARFDDQYSLELMTDERLSDSTGLLYRHVRGVRRIEDGGGPAVADLWVDPASGLVQKIIRAWHRPAGHAGIVQAMIELSGEEPMEDEWYKPTNHHAAPLKFSKPPKNLPPDSILTGR